MIGRTSSGTAVARRMRRSAGHLLLATAALALLVACGGSQESDAAAPSGDAAARTACDHWRDYIRQATDLNAEAAGAFSDALLPSGDPTAGADTFTDNWARMQKLNETVLVEAQEAARQAADADSRYVGLEQDLKAFTSADPVRGLPDPGRVNAGCAAVN